MRPGKRSYSYERMYPWILSLMVLLQPSAPWDDTFPELARAIATVAHDEPLFAGDDGERRTAALLVSLAWFESRFRLDAVGDSGRSVGAFQISRANLLVPASFVTGNAEFAVREARRLISTSMRVCRGRPSRELLGHYAAGGEGCRGLRESRHRVALAERLLALP